MWTRLRRWFNEKERVDLNYTAEEQPMEKEEKEPPWIPVLHTEDDWPNILHYPTVPFDGRTMHPNVLPLPRPTIRPRISTSLFHSPSIETFQAIRDYSTTTTQEKCYDPQDSTLVFVDREDELDFLCEGFSSLRALMSCGHAVTPMSLTNWCLRQLDQGKSRFVCGQSGCNAEWSYEEVCKMALLTPEEIKHFEKTMVSNDTRRNGKPCPKCKSFVVRKNQSNLRVRCRVCPANKGRTFKFCWQCLNEWKGPAPRSDRCKNDGCTNESLKTLMTCPDAVFESVEGVTGCPSIRACPTCGMLLQHDNTQCKNVVCPRCDVEFCFVCLKLTDDCLITSEEFIQCYGGVAPRQTSIPVWQ
ncbi:uncharacterized protein LOC113157543 [Anabas testudineus]|uniref:RING-type domain-containing protein n=1 Tax=Anabas testudineus TaxID=64144 RepID=A0A3Q1H1J9_ANATE|nr:uncharacterized protein LOC113157543 [Anabas testudineus]